MGKGDTLYVSAQNDTGNFADEAVHVNKLAIILFVLASFVLASSVELSFAATSCLSILDTQEKVLTTSADNPYVFSGPNLNIHLKANCSIPKKPNNNPKPKAVTQGNRNGVTVDKIKIEYSDGRTLLFFIDDFAFEYEDRYQTVAFSKPLIFHNVRKDLKIKFSINKSYVGENANILDEIIFYAKYAKMASRPVAPKPIVLRPDLTISGGGAVTEGTAASFTVTASPAPTSPLTVNLTVADAAGSDFVAAGNEGSKTVTVPTSGTATYTVATKGDSTDEPSGSVTVTVVSGSGYTVGSPSSAAVMVNDDDDAGTLQGETSDNAGTPQDKTSDNAAPPKAKPTITPPPQDNGDDTAEPEFMSTRFAFTLAENLVGPAPVLTSGGAPGVVHATGAGVTYTLTGSGAGLFRVDPPTGTVTYVGPGTATGHYELTVRATDASGRVAEAPVIVDVLSAAAVTRLNRVQRTVLPEAARMAAGSAFTAVSGRLEAGRQATRLRVAGHEMLTGAAGGAGTFANRACGAADGCNEVGDETPTRGPNTLNLTQVLTGSEFTLPLSPNGDGTAGGLTPVLWGAVDWTALSGSGTTPDWDGGMLNAHLGVDVRLAPHLLAGVALSHAQGAFDWTDQSDDQVVTGTYTSRLTSLMPYLGWTAHERLELWAAATLGRGEVTLADAAAGQYDSAATAWSAGAGIRGALLADGPTALALKGEAWVSQWEADGTGPVVGVDVDVQRLRLALEGQHAWTFASGAALAPSLEVGVRHDGGAGETGTGLELGGSLHWNDPARGLTLQTRARTLLGRGGYRQWGVAGQAHLDPGADGLGLTLNVAPGWGVADSGVAQLWDEGLTGRPTATLRPEPRLEAALGYGVTAPGTFGTVTPYAGLSLAGAQTWRTGVRLTASPGLDAHLETTWRETLGGAPEHGVTLRARLRF